MSGNCTFKDIERIGIGDGGTPIQVAKISSSGHVEVAAEVAIHQDDSRPAPNTVSWWHEVVCGIVVAPLLYKMTTV